MYDNKKESIMKKHRNKERQTGIKAHEKRRKIR